MSNPNYNKRKTRLGMLAAPAIGLIGIVPFVVQFNLSLVQFLLMTLAATVTAYILGVIFGGTGYLILKYLGYSRSRYLMAYAALLVIAAPIVLDDIYALVSFAPPVLLAAGAFCFIRGPETDTAETPLTSDA